jgi:N-acyl amino acid synthase of PEP-CTERM/exosortase system
MFDSTYEVILADTEAARAIHRKIRYHVYCLERRFEDPAVFPRGEEQDAWDVHAAPFIVRERTSGKWVAATRLVLPDAAQFPVEALRCLTPEPKNHLRRRELAEISRICVIHSPAPYEINRHLDRNFGPVARNGEPEVLLGMIRTIIIYGLEHRIEHNYLLVTDVFARLLRRIGVVLHPVGTPTNHRGLRTPYRVGLRESAASMSAKSDVIRRLLSRKELAYRPFSALDDAREEMAALMPPRLFPLPAAEISGRMEIGPSHPGPDTWFIETARSRPGPGVWRGAAINRS